MSDCFCTKTYQCLACEKGERKIIRATRVARVSSSRKVAVCGTRSGYKRHLKLGEPTCDLCKVAQSMAVLRWQRQNPTEWKAITAKSRQTVKEKGASK